MLFRVAIVFSLGMLSACSEPEAAPLEPSQEVEPAAEMAPPVAAARLPQGVRQPALAELSRAIGSSCPQPTKSEYKGEAGGKHMFAVGCAEGDQLVSFEADGSTSVLSCEAMEQLGGVSCWEPW